MAMAQPKVDERTRISNPRTARTATATRIVKKQRARYGGVVRMSGALAAVVAGLMTYVMLTSNVTSATYAVAKAHAQRDLLLEQTARLDDRIAQMQSQERLAAFAAKLGMHDPGRTALVRVDVRPTVAANRFHMFDTIAGWFGSRPPQAH